MSDTPTTAPANPPKPAEPTKPADAKKAPEPAPARKRIVGPPPVPSNKEIDKFKKDHFGDKPGAVHVDADPGTGKTYLVLIDGEGNEVGRDVYTPKKAGE